MVGLIKVLAASFVMGVWVVFAGGQLEGWMHTGIMNDILGLSMLIVSGALLYGGVLYLLRLKEMNLLVEKVVGKIKLKVES